MAWGGWSARICAWGVHVLTMSGAVFGLLALIAVAQRQWSAAFAWMGVTVLIDAVDGALARFFQVKRWAPNFDGALLDNIVDFFTYVLVPAFFLYASDILSSEFRLLAAAVITLASSYQFCQVEAKTEDHCFTGFPSYWNIVVFYLYLLTPNYPMLNLIVLLVFAVGVFVPIRYLYPSRTPLWRPLNLFLTTVWGGLLVWAWWVYPTGHAAPLYASLLYVVYYGALSLYLTWGAYRRA